MDIEAEKTWISRKAYAWIKGAPAMAKCQLLTATPSICRQAPQACRAIRFRHWRLPRRALANLLQLCVRGVQRPARRPTRLRQFLLLRGYWGMGP